MTCSFTVNLWAWLVLGTCTYKQPEVAQKQKRCQDLLWQGPGPKAPDVEGDPSGTSTFLFDLFLPCCYLMCSHQPLLPLGQPWLLAYRLSGLTGEVTRDGDGAPGQVSTNRGFLCNETKE